MHIVNNKTSLHLPSEPHEKFPVSNRNARYFLFPPRVRTV